MYGVTMAYKATFKVPDSQLGNADVVFTVSTERGRLGELHISRGAVAWKPVHGKESFKLTWINFGKMMEGNGKKLPGT